MTREELFWEEVFAGIFKPESMSQDKWETIKLYARIVTRIKELPPAAGAVLLANMISVVRRHERECLGTARRGEGEVGT
ncbi:MAG TPA: hypothetical protein DEB56_14740 [Thiobacillus sp.]|nr:hypothetical protein [Thiobacillus sp.]